CPLSPLPQAHKLPSVLTASVCADETVTEAQSDAVPIFTGADFSRFEPMPSWPLSFAPQLHRVPSALTATEYRRPAATWIHFSAEILVGTNLFTQVPSPISPLELLPQAHRLPSS